MFDADVEAADVLNQHIERDYSYELADEGGGTES